MSVPESARLRTQQSPSDPAAWEDLLRELDAVAPTLPAQQAWALAVDRWVAFHQLITLTGAETWMQQLSEHLAWMGDICIKNQQLPIAAELLQQELALRLRWMGIAADPVPVAKQLAERAQPLAEAGQTEALSYLLRANYLLIEKTGRPEFALRLAGIHVHYALLTEDKSERMPHFQKALDLIGQLKAAGLSHPLQDAIERDAREKMAQFLEH